MPRGPRIKGKGKRRALKYQQHWDLVIGFRKAPGTPGASFASMDEAREAYLEHQDELVTNAGSRPTGYWLFKADGVCRHYSEGLLWLAEHGEFRDDEVLQLREWGGQYWPPAVEAAYMAKKAGG